MEVPPLWAQESGYWGEVSVLDGSNSSNKHFHILERKEVRNQSYQNR
jgi:hypothetical protein